MGPGNWGCWMRRDWTQRIGPSRVGGLRTHTVGGSTRTGESRWHRDAALQTEAERLGYGLQTTRRRLRGRALSDACLDRASGRTDIDTRSLLDGEHRAVSMLPLPPPPTATVGRLRGGHGCLVAAVLSSMNLSAARGGCYCSTGRRRRHPGSYDDAVREAFAVARREGWHVIPDTTDGEVVQAPRDVTQGYALMAAEALEQLADERAPTHLFLQAGVGGMAAAVCAEFWRALGPKRPLTVIVEPKQAACWHASLTAGAPTAVTGDIIHLWAGLPVAKFPRSRGRSSSLAHTPPWRLMMLRPRPR